MTERTIYFLFTDTGTWLAKIINYFTGQTLNHVSIGFDSGLTKVYSFGRKCPKKPLAAGFVKEDIRGNYLKNAACAIYVYRVADEEWDSILCNLKRIEACRHDYKYNFLGLFGVLFQIRIKRKRALFCSEFVATVLKDAASVQLHKPACFVTPADIRAVPGMRLIYEGRLENYGRHGFVAKNTEMRTRRKMGISHIMKRVGLTTR